ncbi:MAG: TolC family protein, partial [Gammaproteobacteria bacterium]|nr:TolC family protein [Gammaproteobacteria bacterium]
MRRVRTLIAAAWLPMLLAACAGWPSRIPPTRLSPVAPLDEPGTPAGAWPQRDWWRRYQDPTLDRLVALALTDSPSIAVAEARFRSARRGVRVVAAAAGAHVDLAGDVSRQRLSDTGLLPSALTGFSWYSQADLGLRGSYHFDWWGRQRDAVVAASDRARAAAAERAAAALDLSGAVAEAYFGWQTDEARLRLAHAALRTTLAARAITAARAHAGLEPRAAVRSADLRAANLRAGIAALEG